MKASGLIGLIILLPLLGAGLSMIMSTRRWVQQRIGVVVLTVTTAAAAVLLVRVDDVGRVVTQAGGWPAPLGITLMADRFSAAMAFVSSLMLLVVLLFAIGEGGSSKKAAGFHPVYLILATGVAMILFAGDLFNLFVALEVTLSSSYLLLVIDGDREQIRRGVTYVVISVVASTLFLTALGFIYAATGTVNMADLVGKLAALPPSTRDGFRILLFLVFGVKAALFPLFFWLPDSYPTAASPVTALFAGLLTKVGVYAIIRTQVLFRPGVTVVDTVILVIAGLTMVVGVLGAVAQDDMKRILSFHIVSQIGYMVMGLGFFTVAGVAGAMFFVLNQILLKTSLLLVAGSVEHLEGTSRLSAIGGLVKKTPVVAMCFLVSALSLAGLPPFAGFVAKFSLVTAGFASGHWWVTGVSLGVSVLTLYSMSKIWSGAFWGVPADDHRPVPGRDRLPRLMGGVVATLAAFTVIAAIAAGPIASFMDRAATSALDVRGYVQQVLPR